MNTLKMKEVEVLKFSGFVGHEYHKHVGPSWKGNPAFLYDSYVILEGAKLKVAASFACSTSFGWEVGLPGNYGSSSGEDEDFDVSGVIVSAVDGVRGLGTRERRCRRR